MNTHDLGNVIQVILDNKVVDEEVRISWIKILCKDYFALSKVAIDTKKVEQIEAYVRLLQDGDPENENPKKILDQIDEILEGSM